MGHGAEECYRSKQELKPVVKDNVDKQSNDVDGCVVSSALTLVHSEKIMSAPSLKLQLIKEVFVHVNGVLQPIFKLPEVDAFGFLRLNFSYESAAILTQGKWTCVITEMEDGEIFEGGDGCVVVKDGLDVAAAVHAGSGQLKEKLGEGQLAMNSTVVESVAGDVVGNYKLVVPEIVLFSIVNSNMVTHDPVHAFKNGFNTDVSHLLEGDASHAHFNKCVKSAVVCDYDITQFAGEVGGDELMRFDVTEKMVEDDVIFVVDVDELHVPVHAYKMGFNSEVSHALKVNIFKAQLMDGDKSAAVVVGQVDFDQTNVMLDSGSNVMEKLIVDADILSDGLDSGESFYQTDVILDSGILGGLGRESSGPNSVRDGPRHDPVGPNSGRDGPGCVLDGPIIISQHNGLQSDRSVHTSKINKPTKPSKPSKPFSQFKDKQQLDKMDGILKSGIMRKLVQNVIDNSHRAASEAGKTPLQLVQEKLAKGCVSGFCY